MAVSVSAQHLAEHHSRGSPPPRDDLNHFRKEMINILALTQDLLIYLQNVSIGQITGNKIPVRQPTDPTSIKLITDKRGNLSVYRPKK
jgi:hypothetical protein